MTSTHIPSMISCEPMLLYENAKWTEDILTLDRLVEESKRYSSEFRILGKIFDETRVHRGLPDFIDGPSVEDTDAVIRHFLDINTRYPAANPVFCVQIRRAVVWNNMVFVASGDNLIPLYENFRKIDRIEKGIDISFRLREIKERRFVCNAGANSIFFGSAGSFNYGHWLIDDFPRYKALLMHELQSKETICFFSRFGSVIDSIREDALGLIKAKQKISSRLLDSSIPHEFENLIYITPCSEHPFNKNGHAINFVNEAVQANICKSSMRERIFVNRSPSWPRRITNVDEVLSLLRRYSITEIIPDDYNLSQQAEIFSGANLVVGIMGAGMTNTIFCDKGTRVLHLAPTGWQEPFFWDLAASCVHNYNILFGAHENYENLPLHQKSFKIDLVKMAEALKRITSG